MLRRHPVFTLAAALSAMLLVAILVGRAAAWWRARPIGVTSVGNEPVLIPGDPVVARMRFVTVTIHGVVQFGKLKSASPAVASMPAGWSKMTVTDSTNDAFGVTPDPTGGIARLPVWLVALVLAALPGMVASRLPPRQDASHAAGDGLLHPLRV